MAFIKEVPKYIYRYLSNFTNMDPELNTDHQVQLSVGQNFCRFIVKWY